MSMTFVMDKQEYKDKLKKELLKPCFIKLKKDPTDCENRKLVKMLMEAEKRGEISRLERLSANVSGGVWQSKGT